MVTYQVFIGALFSLLHVGAGAFYWLMSEIRTLRQEIRQEIRGLRDEHAQLREELRQEMRENTQRILETLYLHRHDTEGAAVFYPPTQPTTPAE
ncbi:MAG: hypothetical protein OXR67_17185 [Chloroflexota bacterium]|nr:hypothetical protein [Chloroflexota bacterium]